MTKKTDFLTQIAANQFTVGIIGLGYVGLPLALSFALKGIEVVGFDTVEDKVAKVNAAENFIGDVHDSDLIKVVELGVLKATSDFSILDMCQAIFICVPTPLDVFKKPDMSFIEGACIHIGKHMKPGTFVCLESTT
jgi:UDP-N-acetyl-D-glucosamine dehydrogenase